MGLKLLRTMTLTSDLLCGNYDTGEISTCMRVQRNDMQATSMVRVRVRVRVSRAHLPIHLRPQYRGPAHSAPWLELGLGLDYLYF